MKTTQVYRTNKLTGPVGRGRRPALGLGMKVITSPQAKGMIDPPPEPKYRQYRNAPCRCGSGRKFKHCCLVSPR